MNIELILYMVDLFKNINDLCSLFILVTFMVLGICCSASGIHASSNLYQEEPITWKDRAGGKSLLILVKYKWIYILSLMVLILIPSEKTMYLMLGANYLKKSDLPSKVESAIQKKLDEYLKEENK